jgi:nucleoside 2-deoxyribosyltransferase
MTKQRLLLAAPRYNEGDRRVVHSLRRILSKHYEVYLLPGAWDQLLLIQLYGVDEAATGAFVGECGYLAVQDCDVVLCVFDGAHIDTGVGIAQGAAAASRRSKPCYALQTDIRRLLPTGNNPMNNGSLARSPFPTIDAVRSWARRLEKKKSKRRRVK